MSVNKHSMRSVSVNDLHNDLKFSFQLLKESSNTIIIKPIGSINFSNALYFEERMDVLIEEGYTQLFFDMSNTNYVSAVGIGSFIHLLKRVNKAGGNIVLERMQTNVLEVFQLPGFVDIFTINSKINYADPGVEEKYSAGRDLGDF